MRTDQELLAEINAGLPSIDWHRGAQDYVDHFFEKYGRGPVERLAFNKPLNDITPEDPAGSLREIAAYTYNFANSIELLKLKRGARILDVACGGGWVSHWLTKIGYNTLGIDISEEFVRLAHRRIELDPLVSRGPGAPTAEFAVHNLELDDTPEAWRGTFDAAILESCLHHFVDPIAALTHIREMLKPDGLALILEGENRRGAIPAAYLDIMIETRTLERPYPRELLLEVFEHAGFGHHEFLGAINGFFPESSPEARHIAARLADVTSGQNNCVVAASAEALRRVVPSYGEIPAPPPSASAEAAPAPRPSLAARILWRLRRLLGPPAA